MNRKQAARKCCRDSLIRRFPKKNYHDFWNGVITIKLNNKTATLAASATAAEKGKGKK